MTKLFAVYDSVAGAYLAPMAIPSRAAAIRAMSDAVNGGDAMITKHPSDYVLMELASFDEKNGVIVPLPAPERVVVGHDVVSERSPALKVAN